MGIKHSVTKSSREKGYASEWNANHVIDGQVDFNQYQAIELLVENLTGWPAGPQAGQLIFRTNLGDAYIWDGSAWVLMRGSWADQAWGIDPTQTGFTINAGALENVTDGFSDTYLEMYTTNDAEDESYIQLDLGSVRETGQLRMIFSTKQGGESTTGYYKIKVSGDGISWTTVRSGTLSYGTEYVNTDLKFYDVRNVAGGFRYLRVTAWNNQNNPGAGTWLNITEWLLEAEE